LREVAKRSKEFHKVKDRIVGLEVLGKEKH